MGIFGQRVADTDAGTIDPTGGGAAVCQTDVPVEEREIEEEWVDEEDYTEEDYAEEDYVEEVYDEEAYVEEIPYYFIDMEKIDAQYE